MKEKNIAADDVSQVWRLKGRGEKSMQYVTFAAVTKCVRSQLVSRCDPLIKQ